MELDGKVAIVTGGAVRLGRTLALALAEQGVRVGVHYGSSASHARTAVEAIKAMGSNAVAIQADLSQPGGAQSVVERAAAHLGQVDILVNSAAIFEPGNWDDTTEASWDRHFAINLKSPFFLSQAFAAQLGRQRAGHIVNIADWRGARPGPDYVAYTLTKAAVIAMTRSLALALAPNIQVNAIAPGLILPPPGQDQAYLESKANQVPARRVGSPQEIANAMIFLLRSDFVTGDLIFVTGGEHL
ncbi:MAG: SDR family oxidoreductase [Anaerolineae bacterium]|nr:SDR family oxidoreductase [Anaerolineae bacterium]